MKKVNTVRKAIKKAVSPLYIKQSGCRQTWGVFFGKRQIDVSFTKAGAEAMKGRLEKAFPGVQSL